MTRLLVIGLGNPGPEYEATRHNLGFRTADKLAGDAGIRKWLRRYRSLFAEGNLEGARLYLLKPLTYMNLSGIAALEARAGLDLTPAECLVVCDDMELPPGRIRIRPGGGSGGHRGLESIIDALGTEEFPRLRIGIGRPAGAGNPVEHVLGGIEEETPLFEGAVERACAAIRVMVVEGIDAAMNRFNGPQ